MIQGTQPHDVNVWGDELALVVLVGIVFQRAGQLDGDLARVQPPGKQPREPAFDQALYLLFKSRKVILHHIAGIIAHAVLTSKLRLPH